MRKAQTATEYLIILAVVIVIALIVVGVLGGFPSIGGSASESARKAILSSRPVGVTNWAVDQSGTKILFRNNLPDRIKIDSVDIGGHLVTVGKQLNPGEIYTFFTAKSYEEDTGNFETGFSYTYTDLETAASYLLNESDSAIVGNSVAGSSNWEAEFIPGLIASWRFDSDGRDYGSNSYVTENVNNVQYSGGAAIFDGADSYVHVIDGPELGQTHSVSLWLNPSNGHSYSSVFISDYVAAPGFKGIYYRPNSGDRVSFWDFADHYSTASLTEGSWNHVAYVVTGGSLTFYINGAVDATHAGTNTSYKLRKIGADSQTEDLTGLVDEIFVFDRALSESEIVQLYDLGR